MRELLMSKAQQMLLGNGFEVTSFIHSNTCFDLAARRGNLTILLKVFDNVDALREEHALELKKLVRLFNVTVVVVGNKTKSFGLRNGVIYERYGLPAISIDSLRDILEERLPNIRSFKGRKIVELNASRMKERRKELGLTMGELASRLDTSIESIHRYEKGYNTSLQTAEKLEKALKTKLVKKIDLLNEKPEEMENVFDDVMPEKSLERIQGLGVKLALFDHTSFRAGSDPSGRLVIASARTRHEIKSKVAGLQKTDAALQTHGLLITERSKVKTVRKVPIIEEEELTTLNNFDDLMHLLKEREKEEENE